jgi:hypothetical protein
MSLLSTARDPAVEVIWIGGPDEADGLPMEHHWTRYLYRGWRVAADTADAGRLSGNCGTVPWAETIVQRNDLGCSAGVLGGLFGCRGADE